MSIEDTVPYVRQYEKPFTAVVGDSLLVADEYRHAFTEQSFDPATGEYSDANPARSGTTTRNYMTEVSGRHVVEGTLVRAWLKGAVEGKVVYECLAPAGDLTEITLSGSGGCDLTIGGSGEVCIDENVTIVNNGTTIINNTVILGNWYDLSYVTTVCPVHSDHLTIDGVLRSVSPPVVTGLVVERRVVRVPVGTVVSDPYCELDPDYCCESGSGSGSGSGPGPDDSCCSPMPPDVFWATRVEFDEECACVPVCVKFTYDPSRDAWYSPIPTFADCPGSAASGCFRVRCRAGVWFWDVVDGADNVRLGGRVIRVVCDPWFMFALFDDSAGDVLCAPDATDKNLFSYVVTEVDCTPAGSGGCCSGETPRTWAVTLAGLTGDCADFNGTWTLTQDALDPCLWQGTAVSANDLHFSLVDGQAVFSWDAGGGGGRTVYLADFGGDCCSPVTLPLNTNNCDAGVPATVTLTPSCGGTVATPCCPDDLLPATLTATFGGALAGLGTVTLTYVGTGTSWAGSTSGPCGNVNVTLICDTTADKWEMALLGDTSGGWELVDADSCHPLLINATFRAITGACGTGTGTVEVTG